MLAEANIINRKGIEFSLVQLDADLWRWQFRIGETLTTGKTTTKLRGMATRKAQMRIDCELKKRGNGVADTEF